MRARNTYTYIFAACGWQSIWEVIGKLHLQLGLIPLGNETLQASCWQPEYREILAHSTRVTCLNCPVEWPLSKPCPSWGGKAQLQVVKLNNVWRIRHATLHMIYLRGGRRARELFTYLIK